MNDKATNDGIPIWCIATSTWWRQSHSDTCTTYDDGDIVWTMPAGKFRELDIYTDGITTIEHLIEEQTGYDDIENMEYLWSIFPQYNIPYRIMHLVLRQSNNEYLALFESIGI